MKGLNETEGEPAQELGDTDSGQALPFHTSEMSLHSCNLCVPCQKEITRAGDMAQQVKAVATKPEFDS